MGTKDAVCMKMRQGGGKAPALSGCYRSTRMKF